MSIVLLMQITILAEGKMKDAHQRALLQEYQKRIGWKLQIKEVKRLADEPMPKNALIALDETGKNPTSLQFSDMVKQHIEAGQDITLVIGGADGLPPAWKQAASQLIAFGHCTWPHMLVRILLTEQLYRAYSILNNHPYHRG